MNTREFLTIARRLMSHPAVPYHEHAVRGEIEALCREHQLECHRDRFGNLLVRLRASRVRPLVLAAHMDHPGFEIIETSSPTKLRARFRGGVPPAFFHKETKLRLQPGMLPARLGRKLQGLGGFEIISDKIIQETPRFAVWDLPAFHMLNGQIRGRACDDLIGVATVLATLIELKRSHSKVHVIGAISRAEEVGFHGALALAASASLPKNSLIISLETSKELPPVKIGNGVIIRTGDKASVFCSKATRFLAEVATQLEKSSRAFRFQRALMSGGTCEGTAYQEFGYQTAAVCVALGNYHNCGPRNRIAEEYVSVNDARGMTLLLVHAARQMSDFETHTKKLRQRLDGLLREAKNRFASE